MSDDYTKLIEEARAIPMPFEEPLELVLLFDLADALAALVPERRIRAAWVFNESDVKNEQRLVGPWTPVEGEQA